MFASLISSESNFGLQTNHKDKKVKGMAAINSRYFDVGQDFETHIENAAKILKTNLDKHQGNELKAIKAYKGWSSLGERQAKQVIEKGLNTAR